MCLEIVKSQVLSLGFGSVLLQAFHTASSPLFSKEIVQFFPHSLASCFSLGLNYFFPLQFKPVPSQNLFFPWLERCGFI